MFADVIIFILRKYIDPDENNDFIKNYYFIYKIAKDIKDYDIRKITIDDLNEDVYNYHKDLPYGYYLWDIHISSLLSLLKKCIIHLTYELKIRSLKNDKRNK
ncbi:hypothetical protein [Brachyspira sp. G79]|uniref:hypothetical protein n=1 Tax=Brachyspira sp. G79 TaxID=1358104 RepID=UPI000BBBF84E|nr:hypothetical protein [Brachyspira sp. G79]PCG20542.1 hypothetical protein KQ44_11455 [Brachyspira sp. G79]